MLLVNVNVVCLAVVGLFVVVVVVQFLFAQ